MVTPRVWVRSTPCPTARSVFNTLVDSARESCWCQHRDHYDRAMVSLVEDPKGVISLDTTSNNNTSSSSSSLILPMGRARSCPRLDSTPCPTTLVDHHSRTSQQQQQQQQQQQHHRHPFVRLAVVALVLDPISQQLLMTRRPTYMRSFPGAWVLPGGTLDPNESLVQAVQREVYEETGLITTTEDWKFESLWESVYPTTLVPQDGIPPPATAIQAHHLVVYLSNILSSNSTQQRRQQKAASSNHNRNLLQLCSEEVDGAVWLSQEHIHEIVSHTATRRHRESPLLPLHTSSTKISESSSSINICGDSSASSSTVVPLSHLMGIYPQQHQNDDSTSFLAGMAQGSLFALEEFYHSTLSSSSTK